MINTLFLLLAFAIPALSALENASYTPKGALTCKAIYRTLDDKNDTVERSVALIAKAGIGGQVKHSATAEGKFFLLTENRANGDLFGQIIAAPEYTDGSVFRGAPDSFGHFSATQVLGFTVYRLECSRK